MPHLAILTMAVVIAAIILLWKDNSLNRELIMIAKNHFNFNEKQLSNLDTIIDQWKKIGDGDRNKLAYIIATVIGETQLLNVRECFANSDAEARQCIIQYNRPYQEIINGNMYYGRGFTQLTWLTNYEKFKRITGVDIVNYPDKILNDEKLSANIMIIGMYRGTFTGKKLSDYIDGSNIDFYNARRIVNGLDRALDFQELAIEFQ